MFESVLLPAPFSPSSACTSPSRASKSTPSFATTAGKRLTIPRIATAALPVRSDIRASLTRGEPRLPPRRPSSLGAPDHALHQPVHRVEVTHREALALRDAELPLLVVERPGELVEGALDERGLLLRDRSLRLRRHARAVRRKADEAVLDAPVVEGGLPAAVHRRPDAAR